ncbi:MAG TPA: ATP-binding protein [Thermoanaerobaculia bacterium]|nr:ATP-binding protein [Thermoanaerobaculia bacterium]
MIDLAQTLRVPHHGQSWFRFALEYNLGRIVLERKVERHFLKAVRLALAADTAWAVPVPVRAEGPRPAWDGTDRSLDLELVRAFAERRHPDLAADMLLAPVRVHGRLSAVIAVAREARPFERGDGHQLNALCRLLANELMRREERRVDEVLLRIKEEILGKLRPRDLAYQILHGLRELVGYDHSSALLTFDPAARALRVEAEQVAWAKGKSRSIDRELPISAELAQELLVRGQRIVSRRHGDIGPEAAVILAPEGELAEVLSYPLLEGAPEPASTLCAPLVDRGQLLGVLRVAALRRSAFQSWDARVVSRFIPAAVNAIQEAHHRLVREHQALSAEQRAHLVDVARVVAHDINNALGSALPLAQQIEAELAQGVYAPETWRRDLAQIIRSVELSRGIFERLLRQERGRRSMQAPGADVNRVIQDRLALLQAPLERRRAEVVLDLDEALPRAAIYQDRLEHVLWNLLVNALEALPQEGGRITLSTRCGVDGAEGSAAGVELTVADNGCGMAEDDRRRAFEPFFTTKREGTGGLGLPLVRTFLEEVRGRVELSSVAGEGTTVRLSLPIAAVDDGCDGPGVEDAAVELIS